MVPLFGTLIWVNPSQTPTLDASPAPLPNSWVVPLFGTPIWRSKIALVVKRERLLASRGLREACEVLFGDDARAQWEEYFGVDWETGL